MQILAILFTLSLLSPAVVADEYCYDDGFGNLVCRNRLSLAARIVIAVATFFFVAGIFFFINRMRRRRAEQANIALIYPPQNQQQGYPSQYPPPPQEGFPGTPFEGNGQKPPGPGPEYYPQQNGQYNSSHSVPQYGGQYNQQFSPPQYPPPAHDNSQPAPPYSNVPAPTQH